MFMATLVLVRSMLFVPCEYVGISLILYSMLCAHLEKKKDKEKNEKQKEIEKVKEEDNSCRRENGVAGMDYVVYVWRI